MTRLEQLRRAGMACAAGGALWVLALLADVVAHATLYGSATNYRIWECLLVVAQALLLVGVVGLAWTGATGAGRLGKVGLAIALLGRTSFLLGEAHSFIQGHDDVLLVPLGALLTGAGMLLAGIAILRAGRWSGNRRYLPLATGVYPFVAMFPILALTGNPSGVAIALWGSLWLVLGIVLHDAASMQAPRPTPASVYS